MSTKPTGEQATVATAPAAPETLTRADIVALVQESVVAALAAAKPADIQRTEATPAAPAPVESTLEVKTGEAALTRSDIDSAVALAVAPLTEALTKLSGITVVRSDSADPASSPAAPVVKDVFRGAPAFAGLRGVVSVK